MLTNVLWMLERHLLASIVTSLFIYLFFLEKKRVNNQCRQRSVKEERLLAVLVWFFHEIYWNFWKLFQMKWGLQVQQNYVKCELLAIDCKQLIHTVLIFLFDTIKVRYSEKKQKFGAERLFSIPCGPSMTGRGGFQ